MSAWSLVGEEASIVLIGSFNPSIFHPEWFIRHKIVPEWNYEAGQSRGGAAPVAILPDLAQVEFQDDRRLEVFLNKFVIRTTRASEYLTLKDIVTNSFGILQETPIDQMGMNHQVLIEIPELSDWLKFGEQIAPKTPWMNIASYIDDLDDEQQQRLGLWNITMHMPRPDELPGHIRPNIKVENNARRQLSISINSHINLQDENTMTMVDYLNGHWEESLSLAKTLIDRIISSHLGSDS